MEAVREGFNSVFPLTSLSMFYPDELDQIFCGTVQTFTPWDFKVSTNSVCRFLPPIFVCQMLLESCKPAHGFTQESTAVINLFEILSGYVALRTSYQICFWKFL